MSMLNVLEKEINRLNLFEGNMPDVVKYIANSIPSRTIPYRMKIAIAISEIITYTSQFRINIRHWNNSIIPINAITFCIAKSGAAKDSSLKAARKCFKDSYDIINKKRNDAAVKRAIEQAKEAGCDVPEKFACYKEFYSAPNPLFVAISTPEGFIQHLNDLSNDTIGAGYIFSGEFGAELSTNMNLTENIKVLAELYDEGSKEVKVLKARENQSKEVKNLPCSALFIGSQDNLLFDEAIKRKFKTEFTTKLARRSFFIFVNEDIVEDTYESVEEMLKHEKEYEDKTIKQRDEVSQFITDLTKDLIEFPETFITVDDDVRDLFILYKKYNEEIANTIDSQFPIAKLTRTHLQWKALKLSGALALMECSPSIAIEHYKAAIEFVELINNDVAIFERELVKEPYELFTEYCKTYAHKGKFEVSLHQTRKLGFIPMKGQAATAMKELEKLCNSFDEFGTYTYDKKADIISYTEIVKSDTILLSYLECKGTKQYRASHCASGYQCEELHFSDLENMLQGDYAYVPFRFVNGVRGNENIDSTCKWIVLDVDSSEITDEEAHILLSDINHYVVRSSNKDNANKYRVLIELDAEVDIANHKWINFIQFISNDLGFNADRLPKSQIFFSYSGRDILSTLDAEPLEVKPYLNMLEATAKELPKKPTSKSSCNLMLQDPMTTFESAYNAPDGSGRRKLIWACKYARDLGADRDYCKNLLDEITSYWVKGFPESDLDAMKRQLDRWTF